MLQICFFSQWLGLLRAGRGGLSRKVLKLKGLKSRGLAFILGFRLWFHV